MDFYDLVIRRYPILKCFPIKVMNNEVARSTEKLPLSLVSRVERVHG